MKKSFILIGFMLMASMANAQDMANELVMKVIKQLNSHKNYEIAFEIQAGNTITTVGEKQSGKVSIQDKAYRLEMPDQEIISDGTTLWTYLIDDQEVMISDASLESLLTPIKILTTYDKDYTMKYVKSDIAGKKQVEMTNPQGEFRRVILTIDEKKHEIEKAKIELEGGDEMVIDINSYAYDIALKDSFFTFDRKAHRNVDVIDMR